MQIVKVEWMDSCVEHGWQHQDNFVYKPADCTTTGMLAKKTKDIISVALSKGDNTYSEVITIPRKCVKKITLL